MSPTAPHRVRAVHCDYRATDEQVYQALRRATDPLPASWERLRRAQRITCKFNQARPYLKQVTYEGHLQELVDLRVARATLRLLRERTTADIVCTEIAVCKHADPSLPFAGELTLGEVLRAFDVPCLDGDEPPHLVVPVPGGGLMFDQYLLPRSVVETDAFISVQKIKNHKFMGVTLALKNLFGLPPEEPYGRTRHYFHHIIRLPYVLVDLGQIIRPTLSILDGLVAQADAEWGGETRIGNTLVAGEQVIATDACGAFLMGHDPLGDWPEQPFLRDRNALRIAHESGFGTADLRQIDFSSEVSAPIAVFGTTMTDAPEMVRAWHRTTCQQALFYRDHQRQFCQQYAGQYILLQDNEVRWHSPQSEFRGSRRDLAGARPESAMWLKLVDPDESEGEHYEVYERHLAALDSAG